MENMMKFRQWQNAQQIQRWKSEWIFYGRLCKYYYNDNRWSINAIH